MLYYPILKEWELYFDRDDGYENRTKVVEAFTNFWSKPWIKELGIPGKCVLGGKVFQSESFKDGDEIFTSSVKFVEKISFDNICGVRHDLICATTASGSKYYFYSDDHSGLMFLMLGDMIHLGRISDSRVYLKPEYRDSNFI